VTPGRIYLAPGNFHLVVERKGVQLLLRLDSGRPRNIAGVGRPHAAQPGQGVWRRILTTILTGMGSDGLIGGRAVALLVARHRQDEATRVVWGCPAPWRPTAFAAPCCRCRRSRLTS
jgi:two-component system chemotaxis response regulator CheB